jgi:hypothetical protein
LKTKESFITWNWNKGRAEKKERSTSSRERVEEWRLVGGEWCGVVVFRRRRAEKKDRLRTNKGATDLAGDRTMKRWNLGIWRDWNRWAMEIWEIWRTRLLIWI